ncbi:MAG: SpoVG family protein [Candidatus Omnitrophica bacterium]|nr:SpoVG family protein [Candidatus Omnitrophota bacterium]
MPQQIDVVVKQLNKFDGNGTLRAFCDIIIANSILVKGVKVVEGRNGLFVSMPREQGKDGNWYDTVIPLSKEVRQRLTERILEAYQFGENSA